MFTVAMHTEGVSYLDLSKRPLSDELDSFKIISTQPEAL